MQEGDSTMEMKKRFQNILNCMIGTFTGIFIGHIVYLYRNIEFYKLHSISWNEDLIDWGIIWLLEMIVCMIIKYKIKKSFNKE